MMNDEHGGARLNRLTKSQVDRDRTASSDRLVTPTVVNPRRTVGFSFVVAMLLLLVPPFALGGRYAWGQLVIVALVIVWAAAWLVNGLRSGRLELEWSWSHLLWIGGCLLALVQIVPVSEATRDALSPRIHELLPLFTTDTAESATAGRGQWRFSPSQRAHRATPFLR